MAADGAEAIGLAAIGAFFPPGAEVKVADLPEAEQLAGEERELYERLGIEAVVASADYGSGELAAEAARRALEVAGLAPEDVDVVIGLEPRAPDYLLASASTRLQSEIGATRAFAVGIADLGCVSVSAAILVARQLLGNGSPYRNALVATGSKPATTRRYRYPVSIVGDGGIAAVLAPSSANRVVDIELETNGDYSSLFRVDYRDAPYAEWREECTDLPTYSAKLALESRNRFAAINQRLLERAGVARDDVAHWVMQNISLGAFAYYANALDVDFAEACMSNLERYGHLGSMDVLLNIHQAVESGEARSGELMLVMNNSPVAAWSSMLVCV